MLVNQHGACERASVRKEVEKFQLFVASDGRRANSQHLYTLAKVLRAFYKKTDSLKFLLLAFMKLASFVLYSVPISKLACSQRVFAY